MPTPLFDALTNYIQKKDIRFHTPGHSGCSEALSAFAQILPYDVTELPETDSLFEASGAILQAEKLASDFFSKSTDKHVNTFFSAGGCTLAIQTMIALTCLGGGELLVSRNCHRSVINTCTLTGIEPRFVYPGDDGRINSEDVKSLLEKNKKIKAVLLTSPDYYGRLSDISGIAEVCKVHSIPLLVDNAHGTHLMFFKDENGKSMHPVTQGAALSGCSAHKTLPVLTGGAWLNIADKKFAKNAKNIMSLFASSSPSYPIMASLDLCRDYCELQGEKDFVRLEEHVKEVSEFIVSRGFRLINGAKDPVRITINTGDTGFETYKILRENGIQPEFYDERYVVLIPTPFNFSKNCTTRLKSAINKFSAGKFTCDAQIPRTQAVISPAAAIRSKTVRLPVEKSAGFIAGETVSKCPPGIPVLIPGERISDDIVNILKNSSISFVNVIK